MGISKPAIQRCYKHYGTGESGRFELTYDAYDILPKHISLVDLYAHALRLAELNRHRSDFVPATNDVHFQIAGLWHIDGSCVSGFGDLCFKIMNGDEVGYDHRNLLKLLAHKTSTTQSILLPLLSRACLPACRKQLLAAVGTPAVGKEKRKPPPKAASRRICAS